MDNVAELLGGEIEESRFRVSDRVYGAWGGSVLLEINTTVRELLERSRLLLLC